jgi:hypothetical protein
VNGGGVHWLCFSAYGWVGTLKISAMNINDGVGREAANRMTLFLDTGRRLPIDTRLPSGYMTRFLT